jgi:hypothetical protein
VVAYLGLDPRVRQSGEQAARSGSISKRGSVAARWALVEAAWSVVHQPGPLRAFYLRVRSRRGHGKAIVATARKLAVLFWCMLTREQDFLDDRCGCRGPTFAIEGETRLPPRPRPSPGVATWRARDHWRVRSIGGMSRCPRGAAPAGVAGRGPATPGAPNESAS